MHMMGPRMLFYRIKFPSFQVMCGSELSGLVRAGIVDSWWQAIILQGVFNGRRCEAGVQPDAAPRAMQIMK
ncbi:hypothetical protein C7C56_012900 [Massilia glaciei]|uniref:Uncharacterized protein n=1 Tax=Massilia glaciei TaxID=1524097 RepID=A0A2U2HKF4_9BURK|nr:hypothetical protein C7C56_012900 [Massilia glaciei]